jgi:DnaJ-class molecular chaperone
MTIEEAGEVILAGRAWDPCAACKSKGFLFNAQIHDEFAIDTCDVCHGHGSNLNYHYGQACKVLGQALPEPSKLVTNFNRQKLKNKCLAQAYGIGVGPLDFKVDVPMSTSWKGK